METTLHGCPGCTGDRVLVNKLVYDFREPHRGRDHRLRRRGLVRPRGGHPAAGEHRRAGDQRAVTSFLGLGHLQRDRLHQAGHRAARRHRRVLHRRQVTVTPKGSTTPVVLEEPYIYEDSPLTGHALPGPGVRPDHGPRRAALGDGRPPQSSADSRCHIGEEGNGTVPIDRVIGKAFVVGLPVRPDRLLPAPGHLRRARAAAGLRPLARPPGVLLAPYALGLVAVTPVAGLRARRRRRG